MDELDEVEEFGPVETAVRTDVAALDLSDAVTDSYAAIAFNLARKLDAGAGIATAAVAKELRETLITLVEAADDHGSDFISNLSTPVRDVTQLRA